MNGKGATEYDVVKRTDKYGIWKDGKIIENN